MPFTPFHMGPGIALKAVLQGSFSLMVFGWSQIIMDLQPLFVLLSGSGQLHGFTHTYIGATLLAVFSAVSGKYLSEFGLMLVGISTGQNTIRISWRISFLSAFIGSFSHVLLDSIMHSDVEPFYPFIPGNSLLGLFDAATMYQLCIYTGLFGGSVYFTMVFIKRRKIKAAANNE